MLPQLDSWNKLAVFNINSDFSHGIKLIDEKTLIVNQNVYHEVI